VRRHDVRTVHVEGRGPFPYLVDGDDAGDADLLDLAYEPDALTLVLPVGRTRPEPRPRAPARS
jgi:hypothetical protein